MTTPPELTQFDYDNGRDTPPSKRKAYYYEQTCDQCGQAYQAARGSSRWCSDTCRQSALYDKRHIDDRYAAAYDLIEGMGRAGVNQAQEAKKVRAALAQLEELIKHWQAKIYINHH